MVPDFAQQVEKRTGDFMCKVVVGFRSSTFHVRASYIAKRATLFLQLAHENDVAGCKAL